MSESDFLDELQEVELNVEDEPEEILNLSEMSGDDDDEDDDENVDDNSEYDEENDGGSTDGDNDDDDDEDANEDIEANVNDSDINIEYDDDDEDDDDDGDDEHQKIDDDFKNTYIANHHPESIVHNKDEIETLSKVFRDKNGNIKDDFHTTIPFITRFEKAKILGLRARQLNNDPEQAMVDVDISIIDGYKIAEEEYKQKKIPFIIKRPLPNGSCEYWKFEDLEQIE